MADTAGALRSKRPPWGRVSRHCKYCGKVGPRVQVLGGWAHRRCIPRGSFDDRVSSTIGRKD